MNEKGKTRKRCYKNRYAVEKVFGSICDDCPKQQECYEASEVRYCEICDRTLEREGLFSGLCNKCYEEGINEEQWERTQV